MVHHSPVDPSEEDIRPIQQQMFIIKGVLIEQVVIAMREKTAGWVIVE